MAARHQQSDKGETGSGIREERGELSRAVIADENPVAAEEVSA
jgi:hypothetical protein